uniref:Phospholipid phosphatase-related protein type 5 n=1 Tax=Callithrix jacchus TaxID=9483 RepID=A0A8I3W9Y4_CALJA
MPLRPAALTSSMLYFQMVIMAGTVMLAYYFEYTDTFTVNVQGFFCHDSAYRKPYPGPEDSSAVPPVLLYSLAAGVPVLVIIVGETAVFCLQLATRDFENQEKTILTGDCCYINPLVRRTVRFLGIYTFGLFATDIFVNAGQVVTGNLAPHFLALCKPNYTALGCQQYTQFISGEEACTGNPDLIMRARKTFPSKEAALSVYAAMYLTMYITNTIKAKGTRLAKPVLCLGLMCLAFLTGLNRVAEYRNHWSDVIAGFLVGISIAVFLVVCVVNNFKGRQAENEHIHMDNLAQMPMISIPRVESPLEKAECCLHSASPAPCTHTEHGMIMRPGAKNTSQACFWNSAAERTCTGVHQAEREEGCHLMEACKSFLFLCVMRSIWDKYTAGLQITLFHSISFLSNTEKKITLWLGLLSVWSLHVLPISAWLFYPVFLPPSKDVPIR